MTQLYWLTGLSGSVKNTIATQLYNLAIPNCYDLVLLDGDTMREVFGRNKGYSCNDRFALAMQYARLCKMLVEQNINIICATISMFRECQEWNRKHIPGYREIYVRAPFKVLKERDPKKLYSRALSGEYQHVMGIDIPIVEPQNPDLILDNDGTVSPMSQAKLILNKFPLTG